MIPKQYRLPLFAALAAVGLMGACVAVVVTLEDPERAKFGRIRNGMARKELLAVMAREPDQELPEVGFPIHNAGGLVVWEAGDYARVWVWLDTTGRVERKAWRDHRQPFWQRLRRRLHL